LVTVSLTVCTANVAVTYWAWLIFTMQDSAPVHAPLQLTKVEPASGIAVSVTTVPLVKLELHAVPQLMPPGMEATIPVPAPLLVTPSVYILGSAVTANVAVTLRAAVMLTVQVVPVPVQAPLQPVKVAPVPTVAVRVTEVL
jgi:hypothetical protein